MPSCSLLTVQESRQGFCSVPDALQTAQRAELWELTLALQAPELVFTTFHVVRHVGRIVEETDLVRPCELMDDGDLFTLVREMVARAEEGMVSISKVKGHADG